MPRRLALLALVALALAAACGDGGPPVWAPSQAAAGPPSEACLRARKLTARAPALLDEGRLDRAARVLQRAEDLCPAEAPATWALRVRALAAIGRSAEALQLASRIERSDRAGPEARAAAAAARAVAEAQGRTVAERGSRRDAPELFDPAEKRRADADALLLRAAQVAGAGEHALAKKLFLEAWDAWHPNPRALVEAGIEARAAGAPAEAQALWDRAAYDDAASAPHPEIARGAPSILAAATLAFSPGGDRLAVGGDDEIVVFDRALRPTVQLRTGEAVHALAFLLYGSRLYAGLDGGVRVYDTETGAAHDLAGRHGAVRALAVSADAHVVAAAAADGTVPLWDTRSDKEIHALHPTRPALALAFDATGILLAAGADDGRITVWDTRTGELALTLATHGGPVRALAFERTALDVVGATERVVWNLANVLRPRAVRTAHHRARADAAALTAHALQGYHAGVALAGADLSVGALMDETGEAPLSTGPVAEHGGVAAFAIADAGDRYALLYRDRGLALVRIGSPAPPAPPLLVLTRPAPVDALAASPDGRTLVAASAGRALVWRPDGDRLLALASPEPAGVRALAFSPDGRTLALGLEGARIDLHRLPARPLEPPERSLAAAAAVDTLAFSPDGHRLAAGTAAPSVQIFALDPPASAPDGGADTAAPRSLHLEAGPVRAARFSPDGASVLVASREGLTLWTPSTREGLRFVPYGPEARDAAFTPDGGMAVASARGELLLGKPNPSAPSPAQRVLVPAQVLALAVGADGTLVTAEGDLSIALRSPSGKPFQRHRDPDAAPRALALLPGHVAAGLADGSVRLYRAPATGPVAILVPAPGLAAGQLAGVIRGPGGHLEIVGPDAAAAHGAVRCRLGATLYPLEVCAEQFVVEGLLAAVLAGQDPAEVDP